MVAVGNGKILDDGTRLNLEVKEGDHILFGKYSGTDIKIEGEEYLILREDEVLGILAGRRLGSDGVPPGPIRPRQINPRITWRNEEWQSELLTVKIPVKPS